MTDSIYLKGPRINIGWNNYNEENEADTVTVNGITMSVEDFRKLRPPKRRFVGMGMLQQAKKKA